MFYKYLVFFSLYLKIWFYFQEEIIATNDETKKNVILDLFRSYFEHLIEILISKGQLPVSENVFTSEDKESFRAYRSDIIDTMVIFKNKIISNQKIWF